MTQGRKPADIIYYPIERLVDKVLGLKDLPEVDPSVLDFLKRSDKNLLAQMVAGWVDAWIITPKIESAIPGLPRSTRWALFVEKIADAFSINHKAHFKFKLEDALVDVLETIVEPIEEIMNADANPFLLWEVRTEGWDLIITKLGDFRVLEWERQNLENGYYVGEGSSRYRKEIEEEIKPVAVKQVTANKVTPEDKAMALGSKRHFVNYLLEDPSRVGTHYDLEAINAEFGNVNCFLQILDNNPALVKDNLIDANELKFFDGDEMIKFFTHNPQLLQRDRCYEVTHFNHSNTIKRAMVRPTFPSGTMSTKNMQLEFAYELSDLSAKRKGFSGVPIRNTEQLVQPSNWSSRGRRISNQRLMQSGRR